MRKIGVLRQGIFVRPVSDGAPYVIFEITKDRYQNGGHQAGGVIFPLECARLELHL